MASMVLSPVRTHFREEHKNRRLFSNYAPQRRRLGYSPAGQVGTQGSGLGTTRSAPRWDAQSRRLARQNQQLESTLRAIVQLTLKLMLVVLISIGFLYCASAILAASTGVGLKVVALAAWSCGFVPISYHLWNS